MACSVGDSDNGSQAAQCPIPNVDYNENACHDCPGLPCTGNGVTCTSNPHNLGSPSSVMCRCFDRRMVCCDRRFYDVDCWYGSVTPPTCPEDIPVAGEACGANPMACAYPSHCCSTLEVTAYCDGSRWVMVCDSQVREGQRGCNYGATCPPRADAETTENECLCELNGAETAWSCDGVAGAPSDGYDACPAAQPESGGPCNVPPGIACSYGGVQGIHSCSCSAESSNERVWQCAR